MPARDAVVVSAVRTAVGVGKPGRGALRDVHPVDLSALVVAEAVRRSGIDPVLVEDVVWGCVSQVGEQAFDVGRSAALAAGLPEDVTGVTVDRQCGSSQQALHFAAAAVVAGQQDVVVAGGVEVMSRVPMFSSLAGADAFGPRLRARYDDGLVHQGLSAELVARRWDLSRGHLDELAAASHERAAAARDGGLFDDEILPVDTPDGPFAQDQGIRPGTTPEVLAGLRPAFEEDGVVTAGNASQISDGAAALVVTTSELAARAGVRPLARFHTGVTAGVDPVMMLTGPIPATHKVLKRAGLSLADVGTFEVNEAFASVLGAWYAETGADPALTNPDGGAIALGHPLGASGARILVTMLHRMRREGTRYGLQTMCEGGGMANATVLELL